MKRWQAQAEAAFLFRVADNFYVGPMASYDYVIGKHIERPELLNGMDHHTWNVGAGVSLVYDNRDNLTNPHRGIYLNLKQMFRPRFMGNDYAFSTTKFRFDSYQQLGEGTVLAEDFGANFNFGNPSWGMMANLGGTSSMRGYYEGRYRDKHSLEATVELRQHVWKRNGIVVWAGAGTVFLNSLNCAVIGFCLMLAWVTDGSLRRMSMYVWIMDLVSRDSLDSCLISMRHFNTREE